MKRDGKRGAKMKEANVKCVVHSNSLDSPAPSVMITTVNGEKIIKSSWDFLSVQERLQGSCVFNCRVTGTVVKDMGKTLLIRLKNNGKNTAIEVPKREVESRMVTYS